MDKIYEIIDHRMVFTFSGKTVEVDLRHAIWPVSSFALFYYLFWRKTGFKDLSGERKHKKQLPDEDNPDDEPYRVEPFDLPPIKGWVSEVYRKLLRSTVGRAFLMDFAKRQGKIDLFLSLDIPDHPTYHPLLYPTEEERNVNGDFNLEDYIKYSSEDEFHFNTISDYYNAYKKQSATPLDVAKRVIAAIKESEQHKPPMRMIIEFHEDEILELAKESTLRWKEGKQLSIFDGIPVAVKDEIYLAGYPCRHGTPVEELGVKRIPSDEGEMVLRMRHGGAVFIGMANMHQMGIGVTGINPSPYHGTARNPYNTKYPCGGSSSGPTSAVASGLCPVALCADGGGSIRVPAAVCGMVGAKASYARIGDSGFQVACETVAHAGAICATTRDSLLTYGFLAGIDPQYEIGHCQPPVDIDEFEQTDLKGIKIGVDWTYFNDCHPEIVQMCKKAVDYLVQEKHAELIEISIAELPQSQRAHVVATLSEMYTCGKQMYHHHHDQLTTEVENNLALGESFKAVEYFQAQKQRTRFMNILRRLFKKVDCIITPVFGAYMPEIIPEYLRYGFNDLKHATDIIRFVAVGNLAGNPSIAVPIGYAPDTGLPIGLLIQTAWWKENRMFRIAHSASGFCQQKRPEVFYDILQTVSNSSN